MPLSTIPVLVESWPLYNWNDWKSSREALVAGGKTKFFAKEAWNAIVDGLNDAIEAAGLKWDATYTTVDGAKISVAYGNLSARMFNSVRHNLDVLAYLGWAWAHNPDHRGYTGRVEFHGRATHGKECDLVYPEYIIELVDRLNLMTEIMRGTAQLQSAEVPFPIDVAVRADILSSRAAVCECSPNFGVIIQSGIRAGEATVFSHAESFRTVFHPGVIANLAAMSQTYQEHQSSRLVDGNSKIAALTSAGNLSALLLENTALSQPGLVTASQDLSVTMQQANGFSNPCVYGSRSLRIPLKYQAYGLSLLSLRSEVMPAPYVTKIELEGASKPGLAMVVSNTCGISIDPGAQSLQALPMGAQKILQSINKAGGISFPYIDTSRQMLVYHKHDVAAIALAATMFRAILRAPVLIRLNALASLSIPATAGEVSESAVSATALSNSAVTAFCYAMKGSAHYARAVRGIPRVSNNEIVAYSSNSVSGISQSGQTGRSEIFAISCSQGKAVSTKALTTAASYITKPTKLSQKMIAPAGNLMNNEIVSRSNESATGISNHALDTASYKRGAFNSGIVPVSKPALNFCVESTPHTKSNITWLCVEGPRISSQSTPVSGTNITFNGVFASTASVASNAATDMYGTLDTAWYPPVWVDGGLWIRQSHNVTPNEKGELVIL